MVGKNSLVLVVACGAVVVVLAVVVDDGEPKVVGEPVERGEVGAVRITLEIVEGTRTGITTLVEGKVAEAVVV
jgi:hypothetical protein